MAEELIALVQAVCVVAVAWGGVLCFWHRADSSAGLHMFDEAGPVQSRCAEDLPRPDDRIAHPRAAVVGETRPVP